MHDSGQPLTLKDLAGIAYRRRRVALWVLLAALLAGFAMSTRTSGLHLATARLTLDRGKQAAGMTQEPGRENLEESELGTHRELLKTREVARRALSASGLMAGQAYSGANDPVALMVSRIDVALVRGAWILVITLSDEDPRRAESGLQALIEAYRAVLGERVRQRSNENTTLLEREIAELDAKLAATRAEESRFRLAGGVVGDSAEVSHHAEALDALVRERVAQAATAAMAASVVRLVQDAAAHPDAEVRRAAYCSIPRIATDQIVELARSRLLDLLTKRGEHAQRYGPKHPAMIAINEEVDGVTRQLDDAIAAVASAITADAAIAERQLQRQEEAIAQQEARLVKYRLDIAHAKTLQSNREGMERLRSEIVDRLARERIAAADRGRPLMVADPPSASGRIDVGGQLKTVLVALILGSMAAMTAAVIIEFTDRRIRTPEDAEGVAGLPVLMRMPLCALPLDPRQPATAEFEEAVRGLRSALRGHGVGSTGHAVLLVAGGTAGAAAPATAARLAIAFAAAGSPALLVEGDLRNPTYASLFGLKPAPGLSELLAGEPEVSAQPSGCERLDVMPAGTPAANPTELLHSHCLSEWLQLCRQSYAVVILSSPPLAEFADGAELAVQSDDVLLVAEVGVTSRIGLATAVKRLLPMRSRIAGLSVIGA